MELQAGENSKEYNDRWKEIMTEISIDEARSKKGFSGKQVFLIVLITLLVAVVLTYFVLQRYVFAKEFKPVHLSQNESVVLNKKLQALGFQPDITIASNESA